MSGRRLKKNSVQSIVRLKKKTQKKKQRRNLVAMGPLNEFAQ